MTENMVTIEGTNGELVLTEEHLEAAYRHRLREYTIMDARNQVEDVLRHDIETIIEEEDYEELADLFLNGTDCNQDDNSRWEHLIKEYYYSMNN